MDAKTIEFTTLKCRTCGIAFGVPDYLFNYRRQDDEAIHCPSGHENFWKSDKEIEDEDTLKKERDAARAERDEARREQQALKTRIIQLRGQLDQAEAYAADVRPLPPAPAPGPVESSLGVDEIVMPTIVGRDARCPHCDKKYRSRGAFMTHLRHVHKLSNEIAGKMAYPDPEDAASLGKSPPE